MVQWSPDTTPADRNGRAGYDYRDSPHQGLQPHPPLRRRLLALRRLPLPADDRADRLLARAPAAPRSTASSSPASPTPSESGRPGYYSVRLNPVRGGAIDTELTATTRTGMARFTFPAQPARQRPDQRRRQRPARRLRRGQHRSRRTARSTAPPPAASSAASGRATGSTSPPSSTAASTPTAPGKATAERRARPRRATARRPPRNPTTSADAGAYATFDTRHNRVVLARVGVSFVSVEDARANLAAENPGLGFGDGRRRGRRALEQLRWAGSASAAARRRLLDTFYTALYHAVPGAAHLQRRRRRLHRHGRAGAPRRRPHPVRRLLRLGHLPHPDPAALDARPAGGPSEMVRSLLADAAESGCLPRWPYANGQSMTMVGDSADPIDRLRRGLRRHRASTAGRRSPRCCRGADANLPQRQRRIPRAPGPGAVPRPRLRALRPRHQRPQRQLDLRQPRRRLGLGGDLARVHGRRLRDRPVRRPRRCGDRRDLPRASCSVQATGASSSTRPAG